MRWHRAANWASREKWDLGGKLMMKKDLLNPSSLIKCTERTREALHIWIQSAPLWWHQVFFSQTYRRLTEAAWSLNSCHCDTCRARSPPVEWLFKSARNASTSSVNRSKKNNILVSHHGLTPERAIPIRALPVCNFDHFKCSF